MEWSDFLQCTLEFARLDTGGNTGAGDTANIAAADFNDRTVLYDYTGPAVTLAALTVNDAPNITAPSLLMSANNLSATTEYIGNSTAFAGAVGIGWFSQSGGVNTVGSGGLYLGYSGFDFGEYDLSGGTASIAGNVTLANTSGTGFGGIAVSGTGALTVNGTLTAYPGGALDISGGTVNAAALNLNGAPARLQWTGGTLNITNNVTFDSAAAGTTTGAAFGASRTLGSGQTLNITGNETLGGTGTFALTVNSGGTNTVTGNLTINKGSLTINSGGTASSQNYVGIGEVAGSVGQATVTGSSSSLQATTGLTVAQSGQGTLTVNNGAASALNWFTIGGVAGGVGTVTVGGSGSPSNISGAYGIVSGWYGKGTLTINNGGTAYGAMYLGFEPTSEGTINLNTGGTITAGGGGSVWVGGSFNGAGGKGVLNVGGGTLTTTGPLVAFNTIGSTINFSSGTINTPVLNLNGTPSLLNWTGGTLNITNSVTFDSAAAGTTTSAAFGSARTLGTGQTLKITGSETLGGTGSFGLMVNSGGTHTVTNNLMVTRNGEMTINSGGSAAVLDGAISIDGNATTAATVTVTGSGASLQTAATGFGVGVRIGDTGKGVLDVSSGATVSVSSTAVGINAARNVQLGVAASGIGTATVTGAGSSLQTAGQIIIGERGQGTMNVTNGGSVSVTTTTGDSFSGQIAVGSLAGSTGQLSVSGASSSVQAPLVMNIGSSGNGTLAISGGAAAQSMIFNIGSSAGSVGQATVTGAGSQLTAQGLANENVRIRVGGAGNGTLTLSDMAVASAHMTEIGRDAGGVGQVTISGGTSLQTTQYLSVGTGYNPYIVPPVYTGPAGGDGTLTLNAGGTASAGVQLLLGNNGEVDLTGGGKMTVGNVGVLVAAAGSAVIGTGGTVGGTGTIVGTVLNNSGAVLPGFTAGMSQITGAGLLHITGTYTQAAGGALQIELGGTTRGTQYDALLATGQASLGGTLQVSLINSFTPALGNSFDILDASSITSPFTTINLPALGGSLAWDTLRLYTIGQLIVGLPGDYNHDNAVNAADYVVWRKSPFRTQAQYDLWRAHFGDPAGSGNQFAGAVPEPTSIVLLLIALSLTATRSLSLKLARSQASFSET